MLQHAAHLPFHIQPDGMATLDTSRIYTLTAGSASTEKVLGTRSSGAGLEMVYAASSSTPSPSTQWFLAPTSKPFYYRLHMTSLGESWALDVVNDNGTSSVNVHMAATGSYSGQFWRFDRWQTGDGYRLSNDFTGPEMHLGVDSPGRQPCLTSGDFLSQHWTLNPEPAVANIVSLGTAPTTPDSTRTADPAAVSTTTSVTVPTATSVTVSTTTSVNGVTVQFAWK
ncbi:hypothetical protein F4777DRAFT_566440 [Nemania sp. FL0916]|nr:hypothetical protein F4777DRAFT_566440 [Nemania sp. FL0916]